MTPFPCLRGRHVLLVSHGLNFTGAPLLLVETALAMRRGGAAVTIVNLARRPPRRHPAVVHRLNIVASQASLGLVRDADLIIANTTDARGWVRACLSAHPDAATRMIWWLHEINLDLFGSDMGQLGDVAAAVFDSHACLEQWRGGGRPLPTRTAVVHPCVADAFLGAIDPAPPTGRLRAAVSRLTGHLPSCTTRQQARAALGVEPHGFLLGLFASFHPSKGQELLVRTVGRLLERRPDLPLKLLLIGFRHRRAARTFLAGLSPSQRIALAPSRVLPFVDDLHPYYRAIDALVMNSQGVGETFGRVTIEAMAHGKPVLGTEAGGTREIIVDGQTGLLHPLGEAGQDALAGHIERLTADPAAAAAMGAAGQARVIERFTERRYLDEMDRACAPVVRPAG